MTVRKKNNNRLYVAITVALVAVAGSLFGALRLKAAAMVNGRIIPRAEYERNVESFFAASSSGTSISLIPAGVSREVIEDNVMERMINDELLRQAAERNGIKIEAADLEAALDMVKNNPPDAAAMQKIIAALDWSFDDFKMTILLPYVLRSRLQARLGEMELSGRMIEASRKAIIWKFVR